MACTGTCRAPTTCSCRAPPSRSSATSCPRCAARAATRTPSPRPRQVRTRAASRRPRRATDGGWRINGEKWFVTSGDVARVLIVMANVVDGSDRLPTLFLVEPGAPGVEFVDVPQVHAQLPAWPPDDPLHRRRGRSRRGDRRHRQRRGAPASVVHRGAPRDRHPRARRDVAAARRDHRLGALADPGRAADHGLPGRLVPARRFGDRCRARPAAGAPGREAWSTRAPIRS